MTTTPPLAPSPVPWRPADAGRVLFTNLAAGAMLVGGYLGASETARLSHQLSWVSVAVCGLAVAGAANVLWLLAGRRAVGLRLRALLAEHDPLDLPPVPLRPAPPATRPADGLVTVAGGTRFHRPSCLLVRGKSLVAHVPTSRKGPSRVPCEACRPETP